jgi:phage-related protein
MSNADMVRRLKDWRTMGSAAVELAALPTDQAVAVARAIFSEPQMENDRALNLVASVVAKRVREPGMLDAMRLLNENTSTSPRSLYQAKLKAAVALLHFGTPADHKGILRLALDPYARDEEKALLFNQIASRPDLLQNPATLDVLAAALRAQSVGQQTTISVSRALARIQHPKARDILGECPAASGAVYRDAPMHALLDALAAHKPPFTALTIQNLRQVVKKSDPGSVERAKALLKKAGVAP